MFQYALARHLRERKKEVILDSSFYSMGGVKGKDTLREYELDKFNIDENFKKDFSSTAYRATLFEKLFRRIKNESAFVFYRKYLNPKENACLIGFWQSEKYFKDIESIIRKEFTLKDKIEERGDTDESKKYLEKIKNSKNSISINVRRGDYANNQKTRNYHGLLTTDYFLEGIKYIIKEKEYQKEGVDIFVFSDDVDWCMENLNSFKDFGKIIFVPKEISATDTLYLISKCQNNIIANSSFSWWGAWLNENKDKIIIAPKNWTRKRINAKDVCPEDWIRLENRFY